MNKKIILGMTASMILASSVFAFNGQGDMKKACKEKNGHHKMMKKGAHHKKNDRIIHMVMMLDLSSEQKIQIKQILDNSMKDIPNPLSAFTAASFDKTKFIELVKERRDGRLEKEAEAISKVYKLLNATQKKDLKTIIDMQEIKRKKMMNRKANSNGKNCDGRR